MLEGGLSKCITGSLCPGIHFEAIKDLGASESGTVIVDDNINTDMPVPLQSTVGTFLVMVSNHFGDRANVTIYEQREESQVIVRNVTLMQGGIVKYEDCCVGHGDWWASI